MCKISSIQGKTYEISAGTLIAKDTNLDIEHFTYTCKARMSEKCKHLIKFTR